MKGKKAKDAAGGAHAPPGADDIARCDDLACIDETHEHGHAAKPISLHPLDFGTAIKGLLAVPWPEKKKRKKGTRRRS